MVACGRVVGLGISSQDAGEVPIIQQKPKSNACIKVDTYSRTSTRTFTFDVLFTFSYLWFPSIFNFFLLLNMYILFAFLCLSTMFLRVLWPNSLFVARTFVQYFFFQLSSRQWPAFWVSAALCPSWMIPCQDAPIILRWEYVRVQEMINDVFSSFKLNTCR